MNELVIHFLINLSASFIGAFAAIIISWRWNKQYREELKRLKKSMQNTVRKAVKAKE